MKVKIISQTCCRIKSNKPRFAYNFKIGEQKEVPEAHAKKILKNSNFSKVGSKESTKQLNTQESKK